MYKFSVTYFCNMYLKITNIKKYLYEFIKQLLTYNLFNKVANFKRDV